jgi:hypothetical protein
MTAFGWRLAIASVFLFGCATAQTGPPTVDVTGTWFGDYSGGGVTGPMTMTLRQVGADVTGDAVLPGAPQLSGGVRGTVSGDTFSWFYPAGGADATVKGNSMTGFSHRGMRLNLQRQ